MTGLAGVPDQIFKINREANRYAKDHARFATVQNKFFAENPPSHCGTCVYLLFVYRPTIEKKVPNTTIIVMRLSRNIFRVHTLA